MQWALFPSCQVGSNASIQPLISSEYLQSVNRIHLTFLKQCPPIHPELRLFSCRSLWSNVIVAPRCQLPKKELCDSEWFSGWNHNLKGFIKRNLMHFEVFTISNFVRSDRSKSQLLFPAFAATKYLLIYSDSSKGQSTEITFTCKIYILYLFYLSDLISYPIVKNPTCL